MLKKFFIILIAILLLVGLSGNVFAKDTYTATSTINGVTANWEYELNDSNQIENLKCTNPTALTGNVTIPSTLDGKAIVSLAKGAFESATSITEITIPSTVKEIGSWAFSECTSLSKVNLGNVEKINNLSFKNCTALTTIKLPKTLSKDATGKPFLGCTNLKRIELEEGMTVIPNYVCASTAIEEITIPSTVKEIGLWAFSGCTNLSKVNLGNVEKISDLSFKNCTALTSIKLPKTLSKDASGAPFFGCTNLKRIELEEGMTVVPDYVCAGTAIEEITIPSTVKEIGLWAFSGCTNLSKVNLGNVEKISDLSFKNCTALTSIKLPKTLSKDASGAPFFGCTNLKRIELEEGMTVVPDYVCAGTAIEEITIPSTVKEIGMWAFKDCLSLKKITILDNVKEMEGYISSDSDFVFQNHNDDLTIYCYEDSMAAKYAIKYKIKYVYLKRTTTPNGNEEQVDKTPTSNEKTTKTDDTTTAKGVLPQTGVTITSLFIFLMISIFSTIFYIKYKKFRDVK